MLALIWWAHRVRGRGWRATAPASVVESGGPPLAQPPSPPRRRWAIKYIYIYQAVVNSDVIDWNLAWSPARHQIDLVESLV